MTLRMTVRKPSDAMKTPRGAGREDSLPPGARPQPAERIADDEEQARGREIGAAFDHRLAATQREQHRGRDEEQR